MKKKINEKTIKSLCLKTTKMTNWNNHTEARVEIAKELGLSDFQKKFEELIDSHDFDMLEKRIELTNQMFEEIKTNYGSRVLNKIVATL